MKHKKQYIITVYNRHGNKREIKVQAVNLPQAYLIAHEQPNVYKVLAHENDPMGAHYARA